MEEQKRLDLELNSNLIMLRNLCDNSNDFLIREMEIKKLPFAFLSGANLINGTAAYQMVVEPLRELESKEAVTAEDLYYFFETRSMFSMEFSVIYYLDEIFERIMSGFLVILIDGLDKAVCLGMQGFDYRSVGEPTNEVNQFGSNEAFVDSFAVNVGLVRRRLKTPKLKFEQTTLGKKTKTVIVIAYLSDTAAPALVRNVKSRLKKVKLDTLLNEGYLHPFLDSKPYSLFSTVGMTERPDTFCAKLVEGRVGLIVDGTRFAVYVPMLFVENFHNMDDYNHKPFYATIMRSIKYLSFLISILLPGLSLALIIYSPELYPMVSLYSIIANQQVMPFPLIIEVLVINMIYEIMREAGIRAPRSVGQAVSIIGSLVIGDAAISAGIASAPTVIVIAITAISAYVVPELFQQITVLRFIFILLGGFFGLYGIVIGSTILLVHMAVLHNYGISFLTPWAPFSWKSMRDVIFRQSWKRMQDGPGTIQDLPGSHIESGGKSRDES